MIPISPSSSVSMRPRGFSLIELLVTLAIVSIGLLGIGLMQVTSLGFTKTAYSRTQAMLLASDIADRIRANETNAAVYVAHSPSATSSATPGCIGGNVCSGGATTAISDMADWSNRILKEFPATATSRGYIFSQSSPPTAAQSCPSGTTAAPIAAGFMRVLITWDERSGTTLQTNQGGGETTGDCYQFDFAF